MNKEAKLELDGKVYALPTVEGSEGEKAVDVSSLRANTGYITLDDGYGNTGSCVSKITFIDGERGILNIAAFPLKNWRRNPLSLKPPTWSFTAICRITVSCGAFRIC